MSPWWLLPAVVAGWLLGYGLAAQLAARRIADAEDRAFRARIRALSPRVP